MNEETLPAVVETTNVAMGAVEGSSAAAILSSATKAATALSSMISKQGLALDIQGKKYVRVEGWTTLAVLMGCTPREVSNVEQSDGSFIAVVEVARMSDGNVLSRASAECGAADEPRWSEGPRFARRSMAATRATSKACRLAFSWVMSLSGYEVTPAEEMMGVRDFKPVERDDTNQPPAARSGSTGGTSPARISNPSGGFVTSRQAGLIVSTAYNAVKGTKAEDKPWGLLDSLLTFVGVPAHEGGPWKEHLASVYPSNRMDDGLAFLADPAGTIAAANLQAYGLPDDDVSIADATSGTDADGGNQHEILMKHHGDEIYAPTDDEGVPF